MRQLLSRRARRFWLASGAEPSDRVEKLLGLAGVLPSPPPRLHQRLQSVPKAERENLEPVLHQREWRIRQRRLRKVEAGTWGNAGKAKKDAMHAERRRERLGHATH